jgi:hypothetical protein
MRKSFNILGSACLWAALTASGQAVEVAHYAFESTLSDLVTADGSQDLTLFGDAHITSPGIVGEGKLSFDGSGDYATATGTNGFTSGVPAITLSTWFTTTTILSNTQQVLIHIPIQGGTSTQAAAGMEIMAGKLQVGGRSVSTEGFKSNDATLITNELLLNSNTTYFAAAVLDYANDTVTAYLYDGTEWKNQLVDTIDFANSAGSGNQGLTLGRRTDGQRPFNGSMDDTHIFSHALTEAELQDMAGYDAPPTSNGDFDDDGDVDGRDFLLWQRGQSPSQLSPEDLNLWAENYGTVPELTSVTAIPEPGSAALALALSLAVACGRRR